MNLKDLQSKVDETPIIFMPAHYQSLDEARSIWDQILRLLRRMGNQDVPAGRLPDSGGTTIRRDAQGGMLPVPRRYKQEDGWGVHFGRKDQAWDYVGAPPGSRSNPPRHGPNVHNVPPFGDDYFHVNDHGWFWVETDTPGLYGWRFFDIENGKFPPQSVFPQPPTPRGHPGHRAPGHGPNGYPLGSDGVEMPLNPDTGRPWGPNDINPVTGEPYGNDMPWVGAELSLGTQGSSRGDGGLKPGHKPDNPFGGNEGPRSGPPQSGPGRLAYGGRPGGSMMRGGVAARPTRTLQGLRTMGARK